jgi:prephenate dehydrogenase
MKVAIIGGSGKMGKWFARFLLKEGKSVILIGRNEAKLKKIGRELGAEITTNIEVAKQADVILISVPIDHFEEVVTKLSPHTHSEQIILDITSVKVLPVTAMHRHIKKGLILGIHPIFGPGARSVANHNFVLTPTNQQELALAEKVRAYLETKGAKVTLMNPEEHDEAMTIILGLAHFIAIVSADTIANLDRLSQMPQIGGITYKVLLSLVESVISEDPGLYASLQMSLPDLAETEELFQKSAKTWAELVKGKNKPEFISRMRALRTRLEQDNPNFGKAYDNMYKITEGL